MSAFKFKRLFKIRKQIPTNNRPCLKQLSTNQTQPLMIRADSSGLMSPYPTMPRKSPTGRGTDPDKILTPLEALQEFFGHPLTWERNNGYLNAIIGMLVLTFWFTNNRNVKDERKQDEISQKRANYDETHVTNYSDKKVKETNTD